MQVTIGRNTKAAMDVLMISDFPFSSSTLKSNYRTLAKKYHPDVNPTKDAHTMTKKIINAFSILENLATFELKDNEVRIIKEEYEKDKLDMFSFYNPCTACNSTGKTVRRTVGFKNYRVEICTVCKGLCKVKLEVFNPVIPKGAVMV